MKELFDAAFASVNVIPTVLLILIIAYWLFVIVGAVDMDALNFDLDPGDVDIDADVDVDIDADADVDMDADADVSAETDASGILVSLNSILGFFNLGKIPFMLLLSFFILPMWVISIITNHFLHNQSFLLSLALLIPNLIVSLLVSKFLTTPFAMIYTRMSKNKDEGFKYAGKMCTIILPADNKRIGQAEIQNNGNTFRINVLTKDDVRIEKGQSGLIINYIEDRKCYLVEPYKI